MLNAASPRTQPRHNTKNTLTVVTQEDTIHKQKTHPTFVTQELLSHKNTRPTNKKHTYFCHTRTAVTQAHTTHKQNTYCCHTRTAVTQAHTTHVRIVVVVGATRHLHKLVGQGNVLRTDTHVVGSGHGQQGHSSRVAQGLCVFVFVCVFVCVYVCVRVCV
jgi:hypothetical protein